MTIVGLVSGRSGARFRHERAILIISIRPEVESGTLFSIGHMRTWNDYLNSEGGNNLQVNTLNYQCLFADVKRLAAERTGKLLIRILI